MEVPSLHSANPEPKDVASFEALLKDVRGELVDAQACFDIWASIWPTEEVVKVFNLYRGFFIPTRQAHLDRFFIKICNVVDKDRKASSFHKLLGMLARCPSLAPGVRVDDLRHRLGEHEELLKRIRTYRDKSAAHWDRNIKAPLPKVLLGDCRRLLEELETMFNDISSAHSGNIYVFSFQPHSDTQRLLHKLKEVDTQDSSLPPV